LAERYRPTKIIEIGTLSGMSLRAWIHARGDHDIYAIDLSFKPLIRSQKIIPLDLSRVKCIEQNVMTVKFDQIWQASDRVLLYIDAHDLPNVPIMSFMLNQVVPKLPKGSVVAIDDLWYSQNQLSDHNSGSFFEKVVIPQFDPIIYRRLFHAPYWKGGAFVGFQEVIPLMEWSWMRGVNLNIQSGVKMVYFQVPQDISIQSVQFEFSLFQKQIGIIDKNPVDCVVDHLHTKASGQAMIMCHKGTEYFSKDQYPIAHACFHDAKKICPKLKGVSYALGVCLARVGQFDTALKVLNEELQLDISNNKAQCIVGDINKWKSLVRSNLFNIETTSNKSVNAITIFSTLKPSNPLTDGIQRNAVISWTKIIPKPEIILFGYDPAAESLAKELNLFYIPHIRCNENGLPYIDDMFIKAQIVASNDILMYVNADIILTNDLMPAIDIVKQKFETFLMIGQRYDLDIHTEINFNLPDWEQRIREQVEYRGQLHQPTGIDYFIFSKYLWSHIPPFVVGRGGWDNGMLAVAFSEKRIVIDVSSSVKVIHQNHDYNHLKGGPDELRSGNDALYNYNLFGGHINVKTTKAANWTLRNNKLVKKPTLLLLQSYPNSYLSSIVNQDKALKWQSYENFLNRLRADAFEEHKNFYWLTNFGYTVYTSIENCEYLQYKWLLENKQTIKNNEKWQFEILQNQIAFINPDILFFVDPCIPDRQMIQRLELKIPYIVCWLGETVPSNTDLSIYDMVFSNFQTTTDAAKRCGAQNTSMVNIGFPDWLNILKTNNIAQTDVIYIGNWSKLSTIQQNTLLIVAKQFKNSEFSLGLFLQDYQNAPVDLKPYVSDACYGKLKYTIIQHAKIVINFDLFPESGNTRLFETTGLGKLIITEHQNNTDEYFKSGVEIETFKHPNELVQKIFYYLNHPDQLMKISFAAQKRCKHQYPMKNGLRLIHEIILNNYQKKTKMKAQPCHLLNSYAFNSSVLEKIGKQNRKYPISFIGDLSHLSIKGIKFFENVAQTCGLNLWGHGADTLECHPILKGKHHGEVCGLEMFKLMCQSQIVLNHHCDFVENDTNNLRLFEATGCGALLITDYKDNLNDLFEVGKEVVAYRSSEECIDLIHYYMKHPKEARLIAEAGQRRTLRDHSYEERMGDLIEVLKKNI
jgi:hypothetical protein